jgi:hypothetical protein
LKKSSNAQSYLKGGENLTGSKIVPIIIIIMLSIGLVFTSSAAVAYWRDIREVGNVVIRFEREDANLVVDELHETFSGMLVPKGYVNFVGEVEEVEFIYEVYLDKTLVQTMNLRVVATEIKIDDKTDYAHLVQITINNQESEFVGELFNTKVLVRVVVRLLEPIDLDEAVERGLDLDLVNVDDSKAAFHAIKGQTISFKISFSVETREAQVE